MGYCVVFTRAGEGIEAPLVRVEVHLANGLPSFHLVGLAETALKEAKERVRGALINSGFNFPAKRITVNLAPADVPKSGGRYDLAIAIAILAAEGLIAVKQLQDFECVGELSLSGELQPVTGFLPAAQACANAKKTMITAPLNAPEASLIPNLNYLVANTLLSLFLHFSGQEKLKEFQGKTPPHLYNSEQLYWDDIASQEQAKRALTIAAAGGHNLLLVGPPGTGKSMLAKKLTMLLPPLSEREALEVAAIRSIKGETFNLETWRTRPFRSPHHTCSSVSLTGGGRNPQPGEISLAHNGVLFLDELPEFGRSTLDVLREPLETGDISISRAAGQAKYPAAFQLICAMNPSPTGDISDGRTTTDNILRYLQRISGPLLDRIDLQIDVPKLKQYELPSKASSSDSIHDAKKIVMRARERQLNRQGKTNAYLSATEMTTYCELLPADAEFFKQVAHKLGLSMRAFHRTLKVARTLADMCEQDTISKTNLAEAMGYRALDNILNQLASN